VQLPQGINDVPETGGIWLSPQEKTKPHAHISLKDIDFEVNKKCK
jgi:hypothetical protein